MKEKQNIVYFDLETKKLANEVGGWGNKHLMGLSVGVVYLNRHQKFVTYLEDKVEDLIVTLSEADLVVGFNVKNFDYEVLYPYTKVDLKEIPTFDMLEDIHKKLGFRLSLDHLVTATLDGATKIANGLQAVQWYRNGEIDKIINYCIQDVKITKELFEFGCENGYVLYKDRTKGVSKLAVQWKDVVLAEH